MWRVSIWERRKRPIGPPWSGRRLDQGEPGSRHEVAEAAAARQPLILLAIARTPLAPRASTKHIDVIWQNGYGWPVYRGGPMFWGDQVGLGKIAAKMAEYEGQMGAAYAPAKTLTEKAAEGKAFTQ